MNHALWTRRRVLHAATIAVAGLAVGCGGGGGSSASGSRAATRQKITDLHSRLTGSAQTFGTVSPLLGTGGGGSGAVGAPDSAAPGGPPMLAAFFNQVASNSGPRRAARLSAIRRTRQESMPPGEGGGGSILPPERSYWYFDYYLGLWVQVSDSEGRSRYDLFVDEAREIPAGYIETVWPADWRVYPQIWKSSYAFTAGALAGASGSWESTSNEDYSGSSQGFNVYPDGSKDTSASNWTGRGDTSWQSRYEGPGTRWSEHAGTFRSDGTGGLRYSDSDGYGALYQYNRDGSGRATFTGPDPNLPVTIVWDAYGNATILYADGTSERISGWWGRWWGPMPWIDGGPIPADDGTVTVPPATTNG